MCKMGGRLDKNDLFSEYSGTRGIYHEACGMVLCDSVLAFCQKTGHGSLIIERV